jgi:hypothetical protein
MAKEEKFNVFVSKKKRRIFRKIERKEKMAIAIFVLILLLGYLFFRWMNNRSPEEVPAPAPPERIITPQTTSAPDVDPASLFGSANYQSENFRVGDIAIGGEAEFLLVEDTPEPLSISSISGEAFTEKNKSEVKLLISFKTNKLAKSVVAYSRGVGQSEKMVDEEDYSLNHSIIISGLDQASTYIYTIVSHDRFGNAAASDRHAVYTGSKTASLFDLIADAIRDIFGWAINK